MSSIISPETIIKKILNFVIHAALPHTCTCTCIFAKRYLHDIYPPIVIGQDNMYIQ